MRSPHVLVLRREEKRNLEIIVPVLKRSEIAKKSEIEKRRVEREIVIIEIETAITTIGIVIKNEKGTVTIKIGREVGRRTGKKKNLVTVIATEVAGK